MKWTVTGWLTDGYKAQRAGALTAYIYRSLRWPDFCGGADIYEVKYRGAAVALIRFENKGAMVRQLAAASRYTELSDLDMFELAIWVDKLRKRSAWLN